MPVIVSVYAAVCSNDGQKHFMTRIIADEIARPIPDEDDGPDFDESETVG